MTIEQWGVFETVLDGPSSGNPFRDVALSATFSNGADEVTVDGFYDGDGRYLVRFSPPTPGHWRYRITSNAAGLDGLEGGFRASEPTAGNHGPVFVAGMFHFAHADGTPYRPVGTTVYNWVHQPPELYLETLDAVTEAGFDKLRFLVFPQGGNHIAHIPERFPFARTDDGGWDVERPDPEFFQQIDGAVADLLERGIQADVIILHPYDRGQYGLDGLTAEQDATYLRYLVARLSAYRNVWWSLANEYDQHERPEERWDDVFRQLEAIDPYGRLRSIHNWLRLYDYNKPWVTHASIQNGWAVAEPGRAVLYRDAYRKPIVLDEIKYEGDTVERWGNLTPEELVHRFWIATVSGVYASHGESFRDERDSLHIVSGGRFQGTSPARLKFLRRILEEVDGVGLDPIDKWDDDTSTVGIPGRMYLRYLGRRSPGSWAFWLPQGVEGERLEIGDRFRVEILDTWHMTITPVNEIFELDHVGRNAATAPGAVQLPAGAAIALRITRVS
ncbi:DUF5060 domain-containing protein [Lysobacter korlensis]|uniref:DUF5060 domain-containing protein n=1 Tax=Lysobacter korlensis TaxID=553636 RepID=A0ABV6RT84_9GAMM